MQKKSIRLIFSIADLQSEEENFEAPEDGSESAEAGEPSYPLRCSLTITKVCAYTRSLLTPLSLTCRFEQPSVPGSLSVDAVCQEGVFVIENVSYYNDAKLATDLSPEADWKRRGLYIGPQVRHPPFTLLKGRVLGWIVLSVRNSRP